MRKSYNQNSSITRNCGLSQTLHISEEFCTAIFLGSVPEIQQKRCLQYSTYSVAWPREIRNQIQMPP